MVVCLEQDADVHMAQLMPLPLTVSCFSKIQIGFTFLVPVHLGSPGKSAVKRVCVCVCVVYYCSSCATVVEWVFVDEQSDTSEYGGSESPPHVRASQRRSVTLRTPSFLSVCSLEVLHNESVPFPRTSGARFCAAGMIQSTGLSS